MATYQKVETVEARQYSGPRLTVINDTLGEQIAHDGDYLLGTERGKVSVVSKATFEADYKEFTPNAQDEALAAATTKSAELQKQVDALSGSNASLGAEVESLTAEKSALSSQLNDQTALQAKLDAANLALANEISKSASLQAKLDALVSAEQAKADAQATIDKAQAAVDSTIGK